MLVSVGLLLPVSLEQNYINDEIIVHGLYELLIFFAEVLAFAHVSTDSFQCDYISYFIH